jgi:hypothetical protein
VWEVDTGKKRFTVDEERPRLGSLLSYAALVFRPDGRSVAMVGGDLRPAIEFTDTATGQRLPWSIPGLSAVPGDHPWPPHELAFTPDARTYVAAMLNHGAALYDAATNRKLRQYMDLTLFTDQGLALSPDGRAVASGTDGSGVSVWETATAGTRRTLNTGQDGDSPLAFSADGRLLAVGGKEGIRVWHLPTGRPLRSFAGHDGSLKSLAFAADGKLVSLGRDGTALVWDTTDLKPEVKAAPDPIDADAAWASLIGADAAKAYRTMARLGESPAAVGLLRERLKPADAPDAKRIAQLIAQLDHDDFAVREQATKDLESLGQQAEDALRKAAGASPSAEAARRLAGLLEKVAAGATTGERLREIRALEVLEGLGPPEARKLLEELARGAPEAALTREAKASLERLAKRPAVAP